MTKFKPGYKWRAMVKYDNARRIFQNNEHDFLNIENYFDELVIDQWFHLEMMDENSYWLRIGDKKFGIKFSSGEKPEVYEIEE